MCIRDSGYSALVNKGMTHADELLIRSIPMALSRTENVCSSVNVGSTRCGINMDAVRLLGEIIKEDVYKRQVLWCLTGMKRGWESCIQRMRISCSGSWNLKICLDDSSRKRRSRIA